MKNKAQYYSYVLLSKKKRDNSDKWNISYYQWETYFSSVELNAPATWFCEFFPMILSPWIFIAIDGK